MPVSRGASRMIRTLVLAGHGLWLCARTASAQSIPDPCDELRSWLARAGTASAREARLLDACLDDDTSARFSRLPGPWELRQRANAPRESVSVIQSLGYWGATWYNSERAAPAERSGVWSGRGVTAAGGAGVWGRLGALSYAARPQFFWTENRPYTPSKSRVPIGFQHPWLPGVIDAPFRLGPSSHSRFGAGPSWVRLDVGPFGAGVSNAEQSWGPAQLHPLVLGRETGFPHLFVESATPLNVGVGRVSSRWIMGRLARTAYAPGAPPEFRRGIVGMTGAFSPRGLGRLSIGGTRVFSYYENPAESRMTYALLPLSGLLKTASALNFESNQVGSIFASLAPTARLELYGEYFRDDHNWDLRDLIGEPDHSGAWVAGLTWRQRDTVRHHIRSLTLERVNARANHLRRVRQQLPPYTHHALIEGHTHQGFVLGSPVALGGGAISAVMEQRGAAAGWTVSAEFVHDAQDLDEGATWLGRTAGHFSLGFARELQRGSRWYTWDARVQPGLGDIPGANLRLTLSVDGLVSP